MGKSARETAKAADYIAELATELALIARKDGHHALAYILEMAAAEASDNARYWSDGDGREG